MSQTTHALPNPDNVTRTVFDNGLIVLIRENHAAPVAVFEGQLPAGSIHDPVQRTGLAGFVARMLMRGSERFDFTAINDAVENVGADLSISGDELGTNFGFTSLSEDVPALVEVLAEMLRRPTFPDSHIARVRSQTLVQIQERDQDTQRVANLRFYESLYGDHPYGRSTTGYVETVSAIERDDLVTFHAQRYTPNGAIIVVSGDVDTNLLLDLLHQHFDGWTGPAPDLTVPRIPALDEIRELSYPMPDKFQSDIMLGCQAVPRGHPDYYAIRVANTVLGGFGMMGRLGEIIREEQGLAYYAYSSYSAGPDTGPWVATAGVNPANVDQTVESILAEFARLRDERVTEEELGDSQAFMTGVVPLTLETNEGVATTLLNMEWYDLGLDYLERYNDLIYGITPDDIQRVAGAYLRPDAYTLVVAGPEPLPVSP